MNGQIFEIVQSNCNPGPPTIKDPYDNELNRDKTTSIVGSQLTVCPIVSHRHVNGALWDQKMEDVMIEMCVLCLHNKALFV